MIFERMVLTDRISEIVEDQILLQSAQFGDRLYKVFKLCNQSNGQKMKPARWRSLSKLEALALRRIPQHQLESVTNKVSIINPFLINLRYI